MERIILYLDPVLNTRPVLQKAGKLLQVFKTAGLGAYIQAPLL
jgi:hypothetical protein